MWLEDQDIFDNFRRRIANGDRPATHTALALRAAGEALLQQHISSVTDKTLLPHSPSPDPHDYVSIGTYWWPNPNSRDGLPYTKYDGLLSPDFTLYDRPRWDKAADAMVTQVRAAYLLGDLQFATDAARRVRHWFLDAKTRMNPNLNHAQMIPGKQTGGPAGVIDFALYLPTVLDHVELLSRIPSSPWTDIDQAGMVRWCQALTHWLETHPLGLKEKNANNNHGTYYDRFLATMYLFGGMRDKAAGVIQGVLERVRDQIAANGSAPHELKRTCSYSYSLMNARGLLDLAYIGRKIGIDIWPLHTENGGSIPAAVNFVVEHACSKANWPYLQIEPIDWRMVAILSRKASGLSGIGFVRSDMAHRLPSDFELELFEPVAPLHPFGKQRSPQALDPAMHEKADVAVQK